MGQSIEMFLSESNIYIFQTFSVTLKCKKTLFESKHVCVGEEEVYKRLYWHSPTTMLSYSGALTLSGASTAQLSLSIHLAFEKDLSFVKSDIY